MLNAMINVIITEELYDSDYVAKQTEGFEDLKARTAHTTPEAMAPICGVNADMLRRTTLPQRPTQLSISRTIDTTSDASLDALNVSTPAMCPLSSSTAFWSLHTPSHQSLSIDSTKFSTESRSSVSGLRALRGNATA